MTHKCSICRGLLRGASLGALALLSACGGGGTGGGGPISTPAPVPAPTPSPAPAPSPTPTPPPASSFNTAEYRRSDGPAYHNAVTAWQQGVDGRGVTLAIVDSGIDLDSPEFAGRISSKSRDVAGNSTVEGEDSHGTDVALVAAAARDNTGVVGIAYNATILALRADDPGSCASESADDPDSGCSFLDTAIAKGIDAAVTAGARVVNLSLGGSAPEQVVRTAVARAASAGVVIIVSAGNDGDSTDADIDPDNPDPFASGIFGAGNGNVIIAGSVDENGQFSDFSNRAGSFGDAFLSARGEGVCCEYKDGELEITVEDGQRFVTLISGTSFSAPQITGAVALLAQAFPNLTGKQIVDLLLRTARDAGASGTDSTYGRGILDIGKAFEPQGTTTLAGGTIALALGDDLGVGSAAMGDAAGRGTLGTVILDSYQRAYTTDIGQGLRDAQVVPRLTNALTAGTRNLHGGSDRLSIAFTVDARGIARQAMPGQLQLTIDDARQARVLAARAAWQLSPGTQLGFAFAQGADGLVAQLQGRQRPAFMISGTAAGDDGFLRRSDASVALRRKLGAWGLTVSADGGRTIDGAPSALVGDVRARRQREGVQSFAIAADRNFGGIDAALGLTWMNEDRTMLGARFHEALGLAGSDSLFLDAEAGWDIASGWRIGAAMRQGVTRARTSGLIAQGSGLRTGAWSVDIARYGAFAPDDSLAFRLSQPLRVSSGGLNIDLPVAYDYATTSATYGLRQLNLSPQGREVMGEIAWSAPLFGGNGAASVYYRKDPGHFASLPDDKGVALRWTTGF